MSTTQNRRKRPTRKSVEMESFVFEIVDCMPTYSFSVGYSVSDGPYREFTHLNLSCRCVFPTKLSGLEAKMTIMGDRDCPEPERWKADPRWKPRCIGQLEVRASQGRFDTAVPYDSLMFLLVSIRQGDVRMVHLWGPALHRGKSLCGSMRFAREIKEDEF
jgi:hypothetical protein